MMKGSLGQRIENFGEWVNLTMGCLGKETKGKEGEDQSQLGRKRKEKGNKGNKKGQLNTVY